MFCKYCGADIDNNSLFCLKCGKKLNSKNNINNENKNQIIDENAKEKVLINNTLEKQIQKSTKALKIITIILVFVFASIITAIPIVKHHNNEVLDSQLETIENNNVCFIDSIRLVNNNTLQINFSQNAIWDNKSVKKLNCELMIFESGAVVDMDKNGILDLANGYSGYPGNEYSSASNEQRKDEGFGESAGYYNLCINGDDLSIGKKVEKELLFDIDENCKFDENRIYNFHIEINNPSDDRLFNYDCYFRYNSSKFNIVKSIDLKPEDTYFAWHNNELHFARYSSMSSDGYPCYQISDETYDERN